LDNALIHKNSVTDPHWNQCGSGFGCLPQWGSRSRYREPNQCRSGSRSWSAFAFKNVGYWQLRIRIPDPNPHVLPIRIPDLGVKRHQCRSGSRSGSDFAFKNVWFL